MPTCKSCDTCVRRDENPGYSGCIYIAECRDYSLYKAIVDGADSPHKDIPPFHAPTDTELNEAVAAITGMRNLDRSIPDFVTDPNEYGRVMSWLSLNGIVAPEQPAVGTYQRAACMTIMERGRG